MYPSAVTRTPTRRCYTRCVMKTTSMTTTQSCSKTWSIKMITFTLAVRRLSSGGTHVLYTHKIKIRNGSSQHETGAHGHDDPLSCPSTRKFVPRKTETSDRLEEEQDYMQHRDREGQGNSQQRGNWSCFVQSVPDSKRRKRQREITNWKVHTSRARQPEQLKADVLY